MAQVKFVSPQGWDFDGPVMQLVKFGSRGLIGNDRSDAFKKWYKDTFNRDCGCCGRQTNLNSQFKYK